MLSVFAGWRPTNYSHCIQRHDIAVHHSTRKSSGEKQLLALTICEDDNAGKENVKPTLGSIIDDVLSGVVGNAVDNVERANFTQIALHQVHRSGSSELFWHVFFGKDPDLSEAAKGLYIMVFALLANVFLRIQWLLRFGGSPQNRPTSRFPIRQRAHRLIVVCSD